MCKWKMNSALFLKAHDDGIHVIVSAYIDRLTSTECLSTFRELTQFLFQIKNWYRPFIKRYAFCVKQNWRIPSNDRRTNRETKHQLLVSCFRVPQSNVLKSNNVIVKCCKTIRYSESIDPFKSHACHLKLRICWKKNRFWQTLCVKYRRQYRLRF